MDAETLEALKGSIAKWQAIVDGTGIDEGTSNCPLCALFYNSCEYDDDGYENICQGCPVMAVTGYDDCGGSPYSDWARLFYNPADPSSLPRKPTTQEHFAAAIAELEFLQSLLPTEEGA